jgi:23S rRNA (uracil1939-C5)-methyltransferase
MGRRNAKFKLIDQLEITTAGAEGHCIGRTENQVVFVKFAAPGDVVDVQVVVKKKSFQEGKILKFHKKSEKRIEPFCSHFTVCGGCKWQHLSYADQLAFKQQQVIDNLERIGGIFGFDVLPIVGSVKTTAYRNKLDLTFSDKAWVTTFNKLEQSESDKPKALGFHIPGRFDKVLDIDYCHLMPEFVNEIQRGIHAFCLDNQISFFDLITQEGLMRNLLVRCNRKGEWMIVLSFHQNDGDAIQKLMNYVKNSFDNVVSLMYVINEKRNDTLHGLEVQLFDGVPYLTETLGNKTYKIQAQSFFQTNSEQAEVLYDITKDFAGLTGSELVYDLYTGTGSIAIYVADKASKVVGIEYVEEAIIDAKENANMNGVENCIFFAGDMKDILTEEFILEHGKPDVVITDPPRDGMHPSVVARLLEAEPKKIVYVSCNPATQARDSKLLSEKYDLVKIQPVDMFPHTHHVENVAMYLLRQS